MRFMINKYNLFDRVKLYLSFPCSLVVQFDFMILVPIPVVFLFPFFLFVLLQFNVL